MITHKALTVLAGSALLLAACAPSDTPGGARETPSATPTVESSAAPSPIVTVSALPSPTPTATAGGPPPVESLIASTSGLLPLTVGLAPTTNPGAGMIEFDEDYCDLGPEFPVEGDLGRWYALYDPVPDPFGGLTSPFAIGATGTSVLRIDVQSPDIPTAKGISIGSSAAELTAAYPALITGTPGPMSEVYWVKDSHGFLVFEVQSDLVWRVRILALSEDPDFAVASSGNVADACF